MKIGFYSPLNSLMRNHMFLDPNTTSGAGDNLLLPYVRLKEVAKKKGVECMTIDTLPSGDFDAYVFCDMPNASNSVFKWLRRTVNPASL